jgi:hypothetical protein
LWALAKAFVLLLVVVEKLFPLPTTTNLGKYSVRALSAGIYIYIFICKGRLPPPPLLSVLLLKFIVVRTAVRGAARRRK